MSQLSTESSTERAEEKEFETAAFLFSTIEAQITRADTKAGLVIAADSVLTTALLLISRGTLAKLFQPTTSGLERISALVILIVFVVLLGSTLFALVATRPTLKVGNEEPNLFFFGTIAQMEHAKFVEDFNEQDAVQIRHAILAEIHSTSQIAARKFRLIRYSLDFLIAAVVLWIVIQLLVAFLP